MRDKLAATVGDVFWTDLRAHAARDALIIVADDLDLVDVGVAVAADDAATVQAWIRAGKLTKPTAEDLSRWSLEGAARFRSLIVQPFVLIRRPAPGMLS